MVETRLSMTREVDTLLVGEQTPGTWLLVFMTSAREVLSETEAAKITDAVTAVDTLMQQPGQAAGHELDHLFADLVDREPPKPPSLLELEKQQRASTNNQSGRNGE